MSDADTLRALVTAWAGGVETADRGAILAHHADDLVMFDCPDIVRGIDAYSRTWDFFDDSRRGAITFAPGAITVTAGDTAGFASCEVHCDGTTAGPIDFRLTVGFEKRAGAWTIVHEHHSMPVTDTVLIGPDANREETPQ